MSDTTITEREADAFSQLKMLLIPALASLTLARFVFMLFLFLELNDNEQHKGPIGSGHEKTPLVAISSITAGGIIMGFVVAFFAYRICRSKRNTDEPFFGEILLYQLLGLFVSLFLCLLISNFFVLGQGSGQIELSFGKLRLS